MNNRESIFAQKIDKNDGNIVFFNSIYRKCIQLNIDTSKCIANNIGFSREEKKLLKSIHYYSSEDEDLKIIRDAQNVYAKNKQNIDVIYIILTTDCNMACDYCLVKQQAFKSKLTKETFDLFFLKLLEIIERTNKCFKFVIYGGEPTLEIDMLKYVIEKIRTISSSIGIITNGTLLTPDLIKYFISNNVYINVSIDGPQYITNAHRIFKDISNDNVYAIVRKKIDYLSRYYDKNKIALSITLSNDTINNRQQFLEWLAGLGIKKIAFNLIHDFSGYLDEDYFDNAADFFISSYDALKEMNIEDNLMDEFFFYFNKPGVKMTQCASMAGTEIAFMPNGNVYNCHGNACTHTCIGNVYDGFDNLMNFNKINVESYLPLYRTECYKCEAFGLCGGYCCYVNKGNGYCKFIKKITKWAVLRKIGH